MRGGRELRARQIIAPALLPAPGCRVSGAPRGILGLAWGDSAAAAADKLAIRCGAWTPWEGGGGFETCFAEDLVEAFGAQGRLRMILHDDRLCGIQVDYLACTAEMEGALAHELRLSPRELDGHVWNDGSRLRLEKHEGGACTLTLAGPDLGPAFGAFGLRQGLDALAAAMRP